MLKILLLFLGGTSLTLGVIGVFLPVLPAVPFLFLSAYLFARSSQRVYKRLLMNKYFGSQIQDFMLYRAISLQTKIVSVACMSVTMTISAFFFVPYLWLRIVMLAIAVGVSIHILSFKTKSKNTTKFIG